MMPKINWNDIDNKNIPYNEIDRELVSLVKALNNVSGIKTISCCCGHGKEPCDIYMAVRDLNVIRDFCFNYLNPFYNWHFKVENNINRNQDYLILCLKSKSINYDDVCKEIEKLTNKIERNR